MLKVLLLPLFSLLLFCSTSVEGAGFDHSDWGGLLQDHVRLLENGRASQVDYAAIAGKRKVLQAYLQKLSAVKRSEFNFWSKDEQLAFLLNAYNSWTVELILTKYPDLDSIKDLGTLFQSPWKKRFIPLLGETRSLDDIEHGLIRGQGGYKNPLIHFAANCASIGCPALPAEPFVGENLQQQLKLAAGLFLQDRSRNRLENGVLKVSSIFKWYRKDFEQGWQSVTSLEQFFSNHAEDLGLTVDEAIQLRTGRIKIKFLDYDWRLNGLSR